MEVGKVGWGERDTYNNVDIRHFSKKKKKVVVLFRSRDFVKNTV